MNILRTVTKMFQRRPKDTRDTMAVPDSKRDVIDHLQQERVPEIKRRLQYLGLDGKNIRREE